MLVLKTRERMGAENDGYSSPLKYVSAHATTPPRLHIMFNCWTMD